MRLQRPPGGSLSTKRSARAVVTAASNRTVLEVSRVPRSSGLAKSPGSTAMVLPDRSTGFFPLNSSWGPPCEVTPGLPPGRRGAPPPQDLHSCSRTTRTAFGTGWRDRRRPPGASVPENGPAGSPGTAAPVPAGRAPAASVPTGTIPAPFSSNNLPLAALIRPGTVEVGMKPRHRKSRIQDQVAPLLQIPGSTWTLGSPRSVSSTQEQRTMGSISGWRFQVRSAPLWAIRTFLFSSFP